MKGPPVLSHSSARSWWLESRNIYIFHSSFHIFRILCRSLNHQARLTQCLQALPAIILTLSQGSVSHAQNLFNASPLWQNAELIQETQHTKPRPLVHLLIEYFLFSLNIWAWYQRNWCCSTFFIFFSNIFFSFFLFIQSIILDRLLMCVEGFWDMVLILHVMIGIFPLRSRPIRICMEYKFNVCFWRRCSPWTFF